MKAVFLAVLFVCGVDYTANHAVGLHAVKGAMIGLGRGVGAWIYYS